MGTASSKPDGCLMLMCFRDDEDEAYNVDPEHAAVPIIMGSLQQEDIGRMGCEAVTRSRQLLASSGSSDKAAPSTDEGLRISGSFAETQRCSWGSKSRTTILTVERLLSPGALSPHSSLMQESPHHEVEEDTTEGLETFFRSGRDDFIEEVGWSRVKRGPSLAELLQRVEFFGNVDAALSEVRHLQDEKKRNEAIVRCKVLRRFMQVMGPEGPGLAVRKCHRSSSGGKGSAERGKWAARTIHFEPSGAETLSDGTPLGGVICWNSKRIFSREHPGVSVADITKVEHNGKFVWITADEGEGLLGFETASIDDAKFLRRAIDFLISAVVQHTNDMGSSRVSSKTSSLQSTTTIKHIDAATTPADTTAGVYIM